MPQTDISSTTASDLTSEMTDYSVDLAQTDGPTDQKETRWSNTEYSQNLGYYKSIPELRAVIDAKAMWTVGKGFIADEGTEMLLDTFKGFGKDTFNTIIENLVRTMHISGDSYAEIIRDNKGNLLNLKPIDPGVMTHVANSKGIIIRYEQNSKIKGKKPHKFKVDEIFHLIRNRVADEIHGTSMIPVLAKIILMKNEAMEINQIIMKRFAYPRWIIHLDSDEETKIAAFKAKYDKANADGENIYVPKGVVEPELVAVSPNATLNLLPWIESLDDKFYQVAGVPKVVLGGIGAITEGGIKMVYFAFQQTTEEGQLYIEEQTLSQLNLILNFLFPASLENDVYSDKSKEGVNEPEIEQVNNAIEPNDTTAEMEGRK